MGVPLILDNTRATRFEPGTNLKGDVAGAAWTFALPSLELGRVLCAGLPGHAALTTLAQLADRVEVECGPLGRRRLRRLGLPNVVAAAGAREPVDLLVVSRLRLRRPPLERVAPDGVVFDESLRRHVTGGPSNTLSLGSPAPPPRYLRELAGRAGIDLERHGWTLSAPGDYASRKVTIALTPPGGSTPDVVVKLTRSPVFNTRLENERRALDELEAAGIGSDGSVPRTLFAGTHAGLAVLGESAVAGVPFRSLTSARPDCALARAAREWLVELAAQTAHPGDPLEAVAVLDGLLSRFTELYVITPAQRDFLAAQIAAIRSIPALPLVFQHGDPGTWNLLATTDGRVAFLDWEAGEPDGLPLWDLFYFMRSFGVTVARAAGTRDSLAAFERAYLPDTELSRALREAVRESCLRTEMPMELVMPLFYTCWMHRSLKESGRLPPSRLQRGHYVSLLRLCIERCDAPGLRALFSAGREAEVAR